MSDAPGIQAIKESHVLHGHATFDETPPSTAQTADWLSQFADTGPHRIVVSVGSSGIVLGFACSSRYRAHRAFDRTVESSIYLRSESCRRGLGTVLYAELFTVLAATDIRCVVAGVALPNTPSVALHHKFGFHDVGVFEGYAEKHGAPISSLWLQKTLTG